MTKSKGSGSGSRRRVAPMLCNVLGSLLLVAVFALVLPLAGPQLLGYEVFDVVSGSMESAIPVGSAIYVRSAEPDQVQVDEVIAFMRGDAVVAHRVVVNRTSLGEFVTKGDANNVEDPDPVPYDALVGRVMLSVPYVGAAMALYASNVGKLYLLMTLACGIMLNVLADRMRRSDAAAAREALRRTMAEQAGGTGRHAAPGDDAALLQDELQEEGRSFGGGGWLRVVAMAVLALVFVGSAGVVGFVQYERSQAFKTYQTAAAAYVVGAEDDAQGTRPPITVDFEALTSVNPDVVGWLYCESTNIDYPVLQGETNDTYLRHDYTGAYNMNGSVFVDSANRPGFVDANTIVYGHHMGEGVMFEPLEDWADQAFYEAHPVMWLLTPEQDYQVVLVSGHHISAHSDMYEMLYEHDAAFAQFLAEAVRLSDFAPLEDATADPESNYVMLTTCAYIYEDARFVLHGKLVPVPR